jgi:hypothetical protein
MTKFASIVEEKAGYRFVLFLTLQQIGRRPNSIGRSESTL